MELINYIYSRIPFLQSVIKEKHNGIKYTVFVQVTMNDGGNNCIVVGLSGGVDSAAACLKLLESGHEVKGFTMLLSPDGEKTAEKGVAVARLLGIPHVVLDMREEFEQLILRRFVDEYAIGLTPSPCVVCNSCFKFGALWHAIVSHGCNALATGHYARTAIIEGCQALLR